MSVYNLLDHQKECLQQMVDAYKKSGTSNFYYSLTSGWEGVWIDKPGMERIGFEIDSNDLEALESEGLIQLRCGSDGSLLGGSIRKSAVDAVANNFNRPVSVESSIVYQTFYAPVGAVNTGEGNIEIGTQHVGISAGEIASIFTDLRGFVQALPAPDQMEAVENLNDLESELRSNVPRQNRIKAFLLSLWAIANDAVDFAAKLALLAQAYGIDIRHFKS